MQTEIDRRNASPTDRFASGCVAATSPYFTALGAALLAAGMIATLSLTGSHASAAVFLGGVLLASSLSAVSQAANARSTLALRRAELALLRERFAVRAAAESKPDHAREQLRIIDETLPVMITYVDRDGRVRYHNRAYARWIDLDDASIDGRRVAEILGEAAMREVEPRLLEAFEGRDVRYERVQSMRDGSGCHLLAQYLPHFASDGNVAGIFAVLTDITRAMDRRTPAHAAGDTRDARVRLISALEHDEFTLHFQAIASLTPSVPDRAIEEVVLRLNEEEENRLPPGSFLPVADELGLLHEIDRWVVRHVVAFATEAHGRRPSTFMVRLSGETLGDPQFTAFVREQLAAGSLPGEALCFELAESDMLAQRDASHALVHALRGLRCSVAVSGFRGDAVALEMLERLGVDFVKLDGGLVLDMTRSPVGLARVGGIARAARDAGLRIIAECVESEHARAALARMGVHFAQGFGIAAPRPIGANDAAQAAA